MSMRNWILALPMKRSGAGFWGFACVGIILLSMMSIGCKKEDPMSPDDPTSGTYFPPVGGSDWVQVSPNTLGWDMDAMEELKRFLIEKNTKSFMILVDGRIAIEEYLNGHSPTEEWEWNSAGKTLVTAITGIAAAEGRLDIQKPASDYLGNGWTNMPLEKERLITVRNLLTMTSGIDDTRQLVTRQNLTYVADAGTRWAYGNVFQKLMDIVGPQGDESYNRYFNEKLRDRIGMDGRWNHGLIFRIYHSTTRSMARFGLLALHHGKWQDEQIVPEAFFRESTQPSQEINPSYGYLWWLNGGSRYMVPSSQNIFPGRLVPNAPTDMYAAMGARDQRIYVVPSKKMVIIRMGESSDPMNSSFAVSGFDNELWAKINAVIN